MDAIFAFIDERFKSRASESLADLAEDVPLHRRSLAQQAAWVYANREEFLTFLEKPGTLDALVTFTVERLKTFVYERNQYLDLGEASRRTLREHYDVFYRRVRCAVESAESAGMLADGLVEATTASLVRISWVLQGEALAYGGSEAEQRAYYETVACAEYGPEAQLARLHVPELLLEPVLDLGCGSRAALCTFLRQQGVDAVGIDRSAPTLPYCRRVGWEQFDFGVGGWGTVLSHQAFSTHFLFHHAHSESKSLEAARTFVAILRGLRPGGVFVYTPGLPFIEPLIEQAGGYAVTRFALDDAPEALRDIAYACHIVRVG